MYGTLFRPLTGLLIVTCMSIICLPGCGSMVSGTTSAGTTQTSAEKYQTNAKAAVDTLTEVTKLSTAAIKTDVLKGADADNVIAAIGAAKDGIRVADDMAKTDPSGAASKLAMTMGIFAATQTYLATKGVK